MQVPSDTFGGYFWFEARPQSEAERRSSQAQFEVAHQYWVEHADEDRAR